MKLWLVVLNFLTAVLAFFNVILRLVMFNGDGWEIVWGIIWLFIGVSWLIMGFVNLKKYRTEKNNSKDTGEKNG